MENLTGRVALVTGGSRGIGFGISEVLASEGCRVVVASVNEESAESAAANLRAKGHDALGVAVEVADLSSMREAVETAIRIYGRIDIAAANAGISPEHSVSDMTDSDWDRVMDVNAKGVLHTIQACLPVMRQQQYGRIVVTSSITGPITSLPGLAHYGASKAAVLGIIRSVALEVAREGVTLNAVLPGGVLTPGIEELGEDHLRRMIAAIPLGELASPEDIGWAVRYLASKEARFVTGQTLVVDGGQVVPETASC
jgi:3-oxoacyl-[acyl-carrier protein] reductase